MRFITFIKKNGEQAAGWLLDDRYAVDMSEVSEGQLPQSMLEFLDKSEEYFILAKKINAGLDGKSQGVYSLQEVRLVAPLPNPRSFRDFYAFEAHVKTARENRGLGMIDEWYEIPVFYFSNHLAIKGPEEKIEKPGGCRKLDYELEIGCVIGKTGKNIRVDEADDYIFGYCILNDWSARDFQQKEMKVGLGPAKGKDFATSIGPWIVTPDELSSLFDEKGFDLEMKASINGQLLSKGNMKEIHYSFAEMLQRASAEVTLHPGELIGSGTVGSGCILELGEDVHRWLQPGDIVELQIDKLGTLRNVISREKG
ncbi:fumarylacetoacetase [Bacillus sp. FJAT-18017]|uniref:fumarylacetoacetate hydrolase family protein n=1 Tax=Bacillus sp. FJAT-18017 TaxID=1705566 RepID=UPI0006AF1944|nr:fumarylacetoacetate hydrolase family protein [Bacillus sp. FJAT-18017]ALC90377.1 fumarylacetoacetase [Bacillus sp. FJAT-18017]